MGLFSRREHTKISSSIASNRRNERYTLLECLYYLKFALKVYIFNQIGQTQLISILSPSSSYRVFYISLRIEELFWLRVMFPVDSSA